MLFRENCTICGFQGARRLTRGFQGARRFTRGYQGARRLTRGSRGARRLTRGSRVPVVSLVIPVFQPIFS